MSAGMFSDLSIRFLVLLLLVALCAGRALSDQSVKPYPVPEWLQHDFRAGFHPAPGAPFDEKVMQQAHDWGLTLLGDPVGLPWWYDGVGFYDWKDGEKAYVGPTGPRRIIARIRQEGFLASGSTPPMWETETLAKNPDWQWLTTPAAKPVKDPNKTWPPPGGCWYGPFGEWYIAKNVTLAKQLGWDCQGLDGFGGTYTACYCKYCREGYRKATGRDIPSLKAYPAPPDVSDPEYRRFIKWRLEEYDKFVAKWMNALKQIKPDYAFIPWSTGPGRWWHWTYAPLVEHSETANRIVDAPIIELFWDFPPNQAANLLPSFTNRYYRGITRENPVIMCIYFRSQGQQNAAPPQAENDFRIFTVLTNGCLPFLISYVQDQTTSQDHYFEQVKVRQKWTDGTKSVKWAAMLVSQNSRLLYGISGTQGTLKGRAIGSGVDTPDFSKVVPGERRLPAHMESAVGFFRAAQEEHLPLDIIIDADLTDADFLAQYKILVLPNAACLSDAAAESIRKFVANGGGLVALHETSLYNDFGDQRKDFALADLFGASYVGISDHTARWPEYPRPATIKIDTHAITTDPVIWGNHQIFVDNIDYIGMATDVKLAQGAEKVVKRLGGDEPPFLIVSKRGKGRVAYFAADLGQSYFTNPYQYERKLMANAMRWAASEAPTVRVTAPMCVQSTFYQQDGGKRIIVHLLNEINTTAGRALPEGDAPMREEVVPIHDIRVWLSDAGIASAFQEPEHKPLEIRKAEGGVEVTVPRLDQHTMVVFE